MEGIISLTLEIRKIFLVQSKKKKKIGTITLSINPFIPKPATPFQWLPMAPSAVLKRRTNQLRNALKKTPNMKINCDPNVWPESTDFWPGVIGGWRTS